MPQTESPIRENNYRHLPEGFYADAAPTPSPAPTISILNERLITDFGWDSRWFQSPHALDLMSGRQVDPDHPPLSLAYAGHQFGGWSPLLGDGRAHLLGQARDRSGHLIDIQLKGSGRTVYSRGGDGKATLSSALREYLVSEAMAGLDIPATRSLAVLETGEAIFRDGPAKGAILVRTACTHIRVGTFQHAAINLGEDAVRALADDVINQHYPNAAQSEAPYLAFLQSVIGRQAQLVARWMLVGFIHGVMNTDNMSVAGETIDFGPCAFIDEFRPDKVFSSIDRDGRYAWNRQPTMAQWNLARLAETLLPLLHTDEEQAILIAQDVLSGFVPAFDAAFWGGFATKLGLQPTAQSKDLAQRLLSLLTEAEADFTIFFDALTRAAMGQKGDNFVAALPQTDAATSWQTDWLAARMATPCPDQAMRHANPCLIARNHQVERALAAAEKLGDFTLVHRLATALRDPNSLAADDKDLALPPTPAERVTATFCGT